MSDFDKGVEYAFEYLKKNLIGHDVNGIFTGAITTKRLEELRKSIPKKCSLCTTPCGENWCSTKEE